MSVGKAWGPSNPITKTKLKMFININKTLVGFILISFSLNELILQMKQFIVKIFELKEQFAGMLRQEDNRQKISMDFPKSGKM
jgi:hypothetical protein